MVFFACLKFHQSLSLLERVFDFLGVTCRLSSIIYTEEMSTEIDTHTRVCCCHFWCSMLCIFIMIFFTFDGQHIATNSRSLEKSSQPMAKRGDMVNKHTIRITISSAIDGQHSQNEKKNWKNWFHQICCPEVRARNFECVISMEWARRHFDFRVFRLLGHLVGMWGKRREIWIVDYHRPQFFLERLNRWLDATVKLELSS